MSKMKNQKATLTTLNKNKQLKRVYGNRQKIEEMITKLNHLSLTGDNGSIRMKIMGIEGKASNEYWKGVKHFVPNEINFESRTNKPTDILNVKLRVCNSSKRDNQKHTCQWVGPILRTASL